VPVDAKLLGDFDSWLGPASGIVCGALAVIAAAGLLELSRTLAERYRGRWFAGNGRDLFHAGAVFVLGLSFRASGLPSAMAFLTAATAALCPLLFIDQLPSERPKRVGSLLGLFALSAAPILVEPRQVFLALNALARSLF